MGKVLLSILGFLIKRPLLSAAMAGAGAYGAHALTADKKGNSVVNDYVIKPAKEKAKEAFDYVATEGLDKAQEAAGKVFDKIIEAAKEHPLMVGLGAVGIFAWLNGGLSKLLLGALAVGGIYLAYKHFAKEGFNTAAAPNALASAPVQKLDQSVVPPTAMPVAENHNE